MNMRLSRTALPEPEYVMPQGVGVDTRDRWVALPENRAAFLAIQGVAEAVNAGRARRNLNPLLLHGPPGAGKSRLVSDLVEHLTTRAHDRIVRILTAGELVSAEPEDLQAARQADLLVVEDLQHLPARAIEVLVGLIDRGLVRGQQQVFTATEGPAQLTQFPARLTTRIAGGLVVALLPLGPSSRRAFLEERGRQRGLVLQPDVLDWLAEHLPGSIRRLDGALARIESLRRSGEMISLEGVMNCFQIEAEAGKPTVERIVQRVGKYFCVEPMRLQSRSRTRQVLLPRQVGMYLARQLTDLSLDQIGAYFGGRDHSTVLHACRKVEQALTEDVPLSQAVRLLHADLA
jgi:chromosomal replication initiator protein